MKCIRIEKILILICAQFVQLSIKAQQPLTVDELRDGYIRQYVQQEKPYDLSENDVVAYRLTSQPVSPQGACALSFDFMERCPTLRNAGKVMLPPSKYIVTFDSYSKKEKRLTR